MIADALKLSVYFGDSQTSGDRVMSDVLMELFAAAEVPVAALFRGIEGFGVTRRIHAERFPDISTDLPLLAVAVDQAERIEALLGDVDRLMTKGLITLEHARLAAGNDTARARVPEGRGRAGKLTVYCGRGERVGRTIAYRAVVDLLHHLGVAAATVLLGVDGFYGGRRGRATLFSRNVEVPMMVVSVGEPETLEYALARLDNLLDRPLVTLERIALLKRDGELLDRPPAVPDLDEGWPRLWQTLSVYARRAADVGGHALYAQLTRRLREAGAAGATTLVGEWGFSGDERPHGDKLGTAASHVPTYTVYIDRPRKVAEIWPIVDEVTAEHGVVTSRLVPAYRERAGDVVYGKIEPVSRLPLEGIASPADLQAAGKRSPGRVATPETEEGKWLEALKRDAERFAQERGMTEPLVRVTLADGEEFFIAAANPTPGAGFVTLYPHPKSYDDLLETEEGGRVEPRAVVVPLRGIAKVELLAKAPKGTRSLVGFQLWR